MKAGSDDHLQIRSDIRTSIAAIREAGRATQGVKLIRLDEGDEIAAIIGIDDHEDDENEADEIGNSSEIQDGDENVKHDVNAALLEEEIESGKVENEGEEIEDKDEEGSEDNDHNSTDSQ